MTSDLRVAEFLERLSAATPTPGGGSAAALVSSLAAALVAMVAGLTLGKRDYQDCQAQMRAVLQEARNLRARLTLLIDLDAEAFDQVMTAYKLPKEGEEQKQQREKALQTALQRATEVPCEIAERASRVLELAKIVAAQGNKNAASDAGAGIYLAEAALQAALLNIEINLRSIKDEAFKRQFTQRQQALAKPRADTLKTISEQL